MTLPPDQLRRLVRRDLMVAGGGALLAIWSLALVAAARWGFISTLTSGRVVVAIAAVVGAVCVWSWAAGPRAVPARPPDRDDPGVPDRRARA